MKISYLTIISILLLIQNVISDDDDNSLGPSRSRKFKCGRYEKLRRCGCSCTEKCVNKDNPSACPKEKRVKGCFCLIGFYRNSTGSCVPADQCDRGHAKGSDEDEDNFLMSGNYKNRMRTSTPFPGRDREVNRAAKRDTGEDSLVVAEPSAPEGGFDSEPTEGIVQGGLHPDQLAEVMGEDSPGDDDKSKFYPPEGIAQGGLRPDDLEGFPSDQPEEDPNEEPMYPEDEDCGPNEKFTKCGSKCRESLESVKMKRRCPKICDQGCFCKKNFYRDGFSNCNQVPDKYLNDIYGGETKKAAPYKCIRNNEEYDDCGDRCLESVANLHNSTLCEPHQCLRGCYCVKGFLRDEEGICIPARRPKSANDDDDEDDDDDDDKEKDDEEDDEDDDQDEDDALGPGNNRPERRRNNLGGDPRDRGEDGGPRGGMNRGRPGRGPPGRPQRDKPDCPPNEIFSECGNRCMESSDSRGKCDHNWCDVGCFCAPGLHRNRRGICQPSTPGRHMGRPLPPRTPMRDNPDSREGGYPGQRFPRIQPPREPRPPRGMGNRCGGTETYSDCGNRCLESMAAHMGLRKCDPHPCDSGCFCKPGLWRSRVGLCIKPSNSPIAGRGRNRNKPNRPSCPPNEGFTECGNRCMESLRSVITGQRYCDPDRCDVGCFCLPGFYRYSDGQCTKPPRWGRPAGQLCQPNEHYLGCGNDCGQTCDDFIKDREPICPRNCWSGCFCKRGLLRGPNGRCVMPKDCLAGRRFG